MTALEEHSLGEHSLEEQLRAELRAEAETITPVSIADLRLPPGNTGRRPAALRRVGPRQWPAWAKPLAAAAAVAAVVGGTFAAAGSITGMAPAPHTTTAFREPPAYYAYTVQGNIYSYVSHGTQYSESVTGRYLKVRATGTGKLVASVAPPKPYNDFSLISADASGGTFVLGAARYWETTATSALAIRNRRTPMRFSVLRITSGGQTQLSGLALPEMVTPGQKPSIALSPDGARLAMAVGGGPSPAVVRVITLATGRQQQWVWQGVQWTPQLNSKGAWTANGRTLAFSEWFDSSVPAVPVGSADKTFRPPHTTLVHLLDTAAHSAGPASDRLVVLHPPGSQAQQAQIFLTPDGATLINVAIIQWATGFSTGGLALYSVRTGARFASVGNWSWPRGSPPGRGGPPRPTVAWSDASGRRLIILQPSHQLNTLGVLAGRRFSTASALLPRQSSGYTELQYALREGSQLAW